MCVRAFLSETELILRCLPRRRAAAVAAAMMEAAMPKSPQPLPFPRFPFFLGLAFGNLPDIEDFDPLGRPINVTSYQTENAELTSSPGSVIDNYALSAFRQI